MTVKRFGTHDIKSLTFSQSIWTIQTFHTHACHTDIYIHIHNESFICHCDIISLAVYLCFFFLFCFFFVLYIDKNEYPIAWMIRYMSIERQNSDYMVCHSESPTSDYYFSIPNYCKIVERWLKQSSKVFANHSGYMFDWDIYLFLSFSNIFLCTTCAWIYGQNKGQSCVMKGFSSRLIKK